MVVSFVVEEQEFTLSGQATINIDAIFNTENVEKLDADEKLVSLSLPVFPVCQVVDLSTVLNGIVEDEDVFLPRTIYTREVMNDYLAVFCDSTFHERRIVIGAPGVGKSVLTFLAYLWEAAKLRRSIYYIRKTHQSDELTSIFYIRPSSVADQSHVIVNFCRKIPPELFISSIKLALKLETSKKLTVAADGPRYDEKEDVKPQYDLITSGGHPELKGEQVSNMRFVILDSWNEPESIACLKVLRQTCKKDAKEIYDIAGGSVRDLMLNNRARKRLLKSRKNMIANLDSTQKLVLQKSIRASRGVNFDSLRAMYAADEEREDAFQIVQSPLYLRLLRDNIQLDSLREDVEKARMLGIGTLYGIYFELFVHTAMSTLSRLQKQADFVSSSIPFDVVVGIGSWRESVRYLNRQTLYWQPEKGNFPNIGGAMMVGNTLHCLQYLTTKDGFHVFNLITFKTLFLDALPRLGYTNIQVHFITPEDRHFVGVKLPKSQESLATILANPQNLTLRWLKSKDTVQPEAVAAPEGSMPAVATMPAVADHDEDEEMDISDREDSEYFPSDDNGDINFSSSDNATMFGGVAVEFVSTTFSTQLNISTECPFDFLLQPPTV